MDRQRTQICTNANRIGVVSTIPPVNMDRIVSLEYFASADDVHIKLFLSPTTAGLPVHGRWSMPGTDFDSAINVHISFTPRTLRMLKASSYRSLMVGMVRRPLQHGHPAEVSGSPEGSLQPRKKLKVTLATRSGVTQIVIFLTH